MHISHTLHSSVSRLPVSDFYLLYLLTLCHPKPKLIREFTSSAYRLSHSIIFVLTISTISSAQFPSLPPYFSFSFTPRALYISIELYLPNKNLISICIWFPDIHRQSLDCLEFLSIWADPHSSAQYVLFILLVCRFSVSLLSHALVCSGLLIYIYP